MSFFDSLKNSLMGKKSQTPTNKPGHVLGNGKPQEKPQPVAPAYVIYEKTFVEEKIGIGLAEYRELLPIDNGNVVTRAVVHSIAGGSESAKAGVMVGDILLSLNGQEFTEFDDFFNFIVALGRPLTIKFYRNNDTKSSSTGSSIFRAFGSSNASKPAAKPAPVQPALTEEEKKARREMLTKAAADRNQQWEKKLGSGKHNKGTEMKREEANNNFPEDFSNPETLRVIQKTKEMEIKTEQAFGYNPFRPHMSSTGNGAVAMAARNANLNSNSNDGANPAPSLVQPSLSRQNSDNSVYSNSSNSPRNNNPITIPPVESMDDEESELMIADVDDAFAMLLSLGEIEQEKAKTAVLTVRKMLQNLFANRTDPKFRSIRLGNNAFQTKVASVSGAVELLIAAGYQYQFDEPNTPKQNGQLESNNTSTGIKNNRYSLEDDLSSLGNSITNNLPYFGREGYLYHHNDARGNRKLAYTLSRLEELLEMQGQAN